MGRRWSSVLLALVGVACGDDGGGGAAAPDPPATTAPPQISEVSVSAASRPRRQPLVAGETLRIGARIRGGEPPYRVRAHADAPPGDDPAPPAIEAETEVEPPDDAATTLDVALQARLAADTRSGITRLRLEITDARGRGDAADSGDLHVVGADAPRAPPAGAPPRARVLDAAGRARAFFHRGETVVVEVDFGDAVTGGADVSVRAPGDRTLAAARDRPVRGGRLRVPLPVPRLAPAGTYTVVASAGDVRAETALEIRGPAFPPLTALTIDELTLRGGPDQRAPRSVRLRRGETLTVEARVGGARGRIRGIARLRGPDGAAFGEAELGRASPAAIGPAARVYVAGSWRVPGEIPPGRYTLEVEVRGDEHGSTRHRQVLVE